MQEIAPRIEVPMTFNQTVQRALEIYRSQTSKDLLDAAILASDEAGGEWSPIGVQTAAYRVLYK
jgi:hypothetical protein